MTKQRKRARNVTPTITGVTDDSDKSSLCDICDNAVSAGCHLQCNICSGVFHPLCADIKNDVFSVLQPILPSISWVCPVCISSIREKRKLVDNQLQSLSTAFQKLEAEHRSLVQKVDSITTTRPSSATIIQPTGSTPRIVDGTMRDQLRRKRNIIISGFPESQQATDADSLRELCECHLNYKPWFDDSKCLRIGKSSPRLLRVTLASEHAAAELLYAAKARLMKSDNSSVRNIYFNPDLNPVEAQQAYLLRKERRESRQGTMTSAGGNTMLNPAAQPFSTISEGST